MTTTTYPDWTEILCADCGHGYAEVGVNHYMCTGCSKHLSGSDFTLEHDERFAVRANRVGYVTLEGGE